jgi:hypothetical protein
LPDEAVARQHAIAVARELMSHREHETRLWRVQVCDDYLQPLFEVLFADVDATLQGFPRDLRVSIKRVARTAGALNDAVAEAERTLRESKETLARADRVLASIRQHAE